MEPSRLPPELRLACERFAAFYAEEERVIRLLSEQVMRVLWEGYQCAPSV